MLKRFQSCNKVKLNLGLTTLSCLRFSIKESRCPYCNSRLDVSYDECYVGCFNPTCDWTIRFYYPDEIDRGFGMTEYSEGVISDVQYKDLLLYSNDHRIRSFPAKDTTLTELLNKMVLMQSIQQAKLNAKTIPELPQD